MNTKTKQAEIAEKVEANVHVTFNDGHKMLRIAWLGERAASLTSWPVIKSEFHLELTLGEIEKLAYDLLKIINEERQ